MEWIHDIPSGVWYGALAIIALALSYAFALFVLTIVRGGRIKAGQVEIDAETEQSKPTETDVKK